MRNKEWLRYGLASVVVMSVGLGATLLACGDDDNALGGNDAGGGNDTGTGGDTGGGDSGGGDSGKDAGPPGAKLTMVNAVTDLGPNARVPLAAGDAGATGDGGYASTAPALRVCFAGGTDPDPGKLTVTPYAPLPETAPAAGLPPGVYAGTGGTFPDLGLDLEPLNVQPYVMNALTLAQKGVINTGPGTDPGCNELLKPAAADGGGPGGHSFVENVDYWKLPVIPAGTFKSDHSYALVLTGCTDDAPGDMPAGACGPSAGGGGTFTPGGQPGPGNLAVRIYELDKSGAVPADALGTQFVHASAALVAYLNSLPTTEKRVLPGYDTAATDLTTANFKPATDQLPDGGAGVAYAAPISALKGVSGVNPASDYFTANPFLGISEQLTTVDLGTYGADAGGGHYTNGGRFTFIAVGDPAVPTANPFRTFHFLGFINDPPVVKYTP